MPNNIILVKPINFRFGDYISNAFNLYKENFGNMLLATIFVFILSIIPFCGMMAIGNFYKYCRKVKNGIAAEPAEIFNFDDFSKYILVQIIMLGLGFAILLPMLFLAPLISHYGDQSGSLGLMILASYAFVVFAAILYFAVKIFYISGLIAFLGISDFNTLWKMSSEMSKGNFLQIIFFAIVVSIIAELGVIACGVGIIFTIPIYYISYYFANEDAVDQITPNVEPEQKF